MFVFLGVASAIYNLRGVLLEQEVSDSLLQEGWGEDSHLGGKR